MSKMSINKTTGELTSGLTALLNQIRDSKKTAQTYLNGLKAVEDRIRAKMDEERLEQDRILQEEEDRARKELEEETMAQAENRRGVADVPEQPEEAPTEPTPVQEPRPRTEAPAVRPTRVVERPQERPQQPRTGMDRRAEAGPRGPRNAAVPGGAPRTDRRPADGARGTRGQTDRPPRSGQPAGARGSFAGGKDKDAPAAQRRTPAPRRERSDVLPMQEKERSAYDPNKKQYDRAARERDNTVARGKNKKTLAREQAPEITLDDDFMRSRKAKRKNAARPQAMPERRVIESAVMTTETITIKDLSEKLGKPSAQIIKTLFMIGMMVTINSEIDYDTASLVATEYGITLEQKLAATAEETLAANFEEEDTASEEGLVERPPVVTVMGHVDHGKTSLLDAIRNTRVTATEAGGITQAIGAYTIDVNGKSITFVDTPGHEAFTAMRARGAQVTDVAILVVAADDGVMPQTIEAINHIQAAKVPMIVAINKIDRPTANVDRVMQELTQYSVVAEDWGGDTVMVPVSALTGENLDRLLEMILLVAEVEELTANPKRRARGAVLEASLDRGRGAVATILVQDGTLHVGDYIVAGTAAGRVRAMLNDKGESVMEAGPSTPVEVMGFSDVPDAGDQLYAVDDERLSRRVAEERREKIKIEQMKAASRVTLDDLFDRISEGEMKELRLIIKADVHGSAEAIRQSMEKLSNEEVRVVCLHAGVGAITESDVNLAASSNAIIIGFNIRPDAMGRAAAERENVDVRLYRVIYDAIEEVKLAMKGMLAPTYREVVLGHAEVRTIFTVSSVGTVAGSYVTDGRMLRNASARLVRDGVVVYEGKMSSLRRFKDDVREVASGYECGITLENYNDLKEGDVIEAFQMEEIAR